MSSILPLGALRKERRAARPDTEQTAQGNCRRRSQRIEHDAGCFACRDHVHGPRPLQRSDDVGVCERATYESAGVDALDGGTHDGIEILAEPVALALSESEERVERVAVFQLGGVS